MCGFRLSSGLCFRCYGVVNGLLSMFLFRKWFCLLIAVMLVRLCRKVCIGEV